MSEKTRNSLLLQSRMQVKDLQSKINAHRETMAKYLWEIKRLKEKLAKEEAAHSATRHDFHKRQLHWLGNFEEVMEQRQYEKQRRQEDDDATSATITGALILNAPISEPPHLGKHQGKDVICIKAMSKMDLITEQPFYREMGCPANQRKS